jgi:hypothetical protein
MRWKGGWELGFEGWSWGLVWYDVFGIDGVGWLMTKGFEIRVSGRVVMVEKWTVNSRLWFQVGNRM